MKLLFVYTNVNGTHLDSYAVGIHMIMSVAKRAGHDVNLIRILKLDDYHLIDKALENFNPDIVGFTAVSSQFSFIKDLCDIVKKQFPKINFYHEPLAHDSGNSLGGALLSWYEHSQDTVIKPRKTLYNGPQYSKEELLESVKKYI